MLNLSIRLLFLLSVIGVSAQNVTIEDIGPNELAVKAFRMNESGTLNVKGTGGVFKDDYKLLFYYGWILDSDTREVVWHLFNEVKGRDYTESDGFYDFNLDVQLEAGDYELYFTGAHDNRGWNNEWTINSFNELIDEIFDSRNHEKFRRSLQEDLMIQVSSSKLTTVDLDKVLDKQLSKAIAFFVKAENDEKFEQGITLDGDTRLRIYANGEGRRDEVFDYLWIHNAATRERVFDMNYRNTSFAGGAEKNLKLDEEITLPKGSYMISYRTDDSHSFEEWNALPPDDPIFWGVAIYPASEADRKNVKPFEAPKTMQPVAELTRIGDNELASVGLSVKSDMEVRVICLGERGYDDDMADYGWIVDANTREVVWKMKEYRSDHAGGASKNRRVEDVLGLKKGEYIIYYKTDGSHSFDRWNSTRPHEEELWGITVWATDEKNLSRIEIFDPKEYTAANVIAEIIMVGDHEYSKASFDLEKETRVTILAQGEGRDGEMYDFAWIRNMDNGNVVWEMDYYETRHAGGSKKNRMISETITLSPGEYRVYYETDGSHSFSRWNADPPSDPQSYGVRILRAE